MDQVAQFTAAKTLKAFFLLPPSLRPGHDYRLSVIGSVTQTSIGVKAMKIRPSLEQQLTHPRAVMVLCEEYRSLTFGPPVVQGSG